MSIPNTFTHVVLVTGSRSWGDTALMRQAFNQAWLTWGVENVQRPVLISGQAPKGADAMAEKLWYEAGFEIITFPADWHGLGNSAGVKRNQQMVDAAMVFRDAGAEVLCTAFLDLCQQPRCNHRGQPGHYSHGTSHCRSLALKQGFQVIDTYARSALASV